MWGGVKWSSDAIGHRCVAPRVLLSTVTIRDGRVSIVASVRLGFRHGCRHEMMHSKDVDGSVLGGHLFGGVPRSGAASIAG